jgi:glycosyltransferase involved in cell wall biosynthesis
MRIAFVLLDAQVTGGQVVAHDLMRSAQAAGHDVLAVFPEPGEMLSRVSDDGFATRVVPLDRSYRFDQALRLARLLRSERIDVVDTHTLFVGDQLSRAAATVARVPLVAHAHIDERFSQRTHVARVQRTVARHTANRCAAIIAVSDHVRRTLLAIGVRPELVTTIHNGVHPAPLSAHRRSQELRLLCIARLAPVKGQAELLEALAQAGPGIRVDFVGDDLESDGKYRDELVRLALRLGIDDRVSFLGRRDDVRSLLEQHDALVLPSFAEGLPLVVLEAMERGRAVLATAVGGTPELIVDGESGALVPAGRPDALAAMLRRFRDEPDLVERLGSAGRRRVQSDFTAERTAGLTLAVLAAAAAGGGPSGHTPDTAPR